MDAVEHTKIPIERIDAPGEAWLELRGSILVFHKRTWVSSASMFIPVEWLTKAEKRRRDLRCLWRGLLGLMIAGLTALPLSLLFIAMPRRDPAEDVLAVFLGVLVALSVGIGLWQLARFVRPRGALTLYVEGWPRHSAIAFWYAPARVPVLDGLLEAIDTLHGRFEQGDLEPTRMSHMWLHPRPYRMALVKGFVVSFLLYGLLLFFEVTRLAGVGPQFPRWLYAALIFPPAFYLAAVAVRQGFRLREPKAFRQAIGHYHRGALADAGACLENLLAQQPGHALGRLLLVRVCTERGDFDAALRHCEALVAEDPVLAAQLQKNVWSIRRMVERMGPEGDALPRCDGNG